MSRELYESMRTHPETGPVLELLDMADGADLFSRALALVRDCFSPSDTLRHLSRRKLRAIMKRRVAIVFAYETAVVAAAKEHGAEPKDFGEAAAALPAEVFEKLRTDFAKQIEELKLHGLDADGSL